MNHRELILSRDRKPRFFFLQLPLELQDRIIDGLDSGELTLEQAAGLTKLQGQYLSHEAISDYYQAVRRERRVFELNNTATRLIAEFAAAPDGQGLQALVNVVTQTALLGLVDGTVKIRPVDLAKLLELQRGAAATEPRPESDNQKPAMTQAEVAQRIREQYGI
ncbi:MAG: hypothetical protein A2V67_04925 [Deltaproteobacteria bacterium RBG_13_61_14]|nr:MAG: hypothetical protein A2V67_04925 [Deltaproteobacteria bacterium RBG_13_61_14]